MLSACNQFKDTIESIKFGQVMTEVVLTVDYLEVVSLISRNSAERMGLWGERFSGCYSIGLAAGAGFGFVRGLTASEQGF